ncbi:MAG TPA: TIR domain-containing protein [Pyrinomonadaceae bacterium]|nr:TIR domain-containing protein [Pyrinomonadaceae bacterium]
MITSAQQRKDVFVSYSSADLAWVDKELLTRLREARIIYVEPRDFAEGSSMLKEIEDAIISSRRSVLVVTSDYLKELDRIESNQNPADGDTATNGDSWNEFVNGMIFSYMLKERKLSIIPIIKDEGLDLPPRFGALVPANLFEATDQLWLRLTNTLASELGCPERSRTPTPRGESIAGDGLELILNLVAKPEVRGPLSEFRSDFEDLSQRMKTLNRLKKLHDKFQELEGSYNNLRYGKGEADERVDWDDIEAAVPDLADMVDDLVTDACDFAFARPEDVWVQKLSSAINELRQAVIAKDINKLRGGNRRLSGVLGTQPSRINVNMVAEAKHLRLTSLEGALMTVHEILDKFTRSATTSDQLAKITMSIEKIDEMDRVLRTVLYNHDSLQEIGTELRRVERSLDEGIGIVKEFWEDLRPKMQLLCADQSQDWAAKLAEADLALKNSFPSDEGLEADEPGIRQQFKLFRKQATRSFNRVDREMLRKCNELENDIGRPLATLLALLPGEIRA